MARSRNNGASWVIGALAVAQIAVGAVVVATHDEGIDHPDAWDPRVADLVTFVEDERGHTFEHPVTIDFLTPEQYSERTRGDAGDLSADDLEEIEQAESLMRAVGLVTGDIDLVESVSDLSDSGTLAFYSSDDEKVVVRGTDLTPQLRATLVHELTHVLQDQVWDIDRLDGDAPSGAHTAWRALVEGDADRIEEAYEDTLSEEEQDAIAAEDEENRSGFDELEVPPALTTLFAMPYILGEGFIDLMEATSDARLDEAFADPPTTEEHLLDPFRFLSGDEALDVDVPDTDGADVLDEGDFGAASLYIVLAERIAPLDALNAATGWGGDAYAAFERDGRTCVRIDVRGDNADEDAELEAAFASWAAAAPAGTAGSRYQDGIARLESCDPGEAAIPGAGTSMNALVLATLRVAAASVVLDSGGNEEQAKCYGARIVEVVPFDLLTVDADEVAPELEQELAALALQAAAECR